MQAFKRFYVWGMNAKFYMGIYFVAIVFLTGVVTALTGGESLRLVHLLQMLIVAMGAALAQVLLLEGRHPRSAASLRVRSVLWVVGTAVATGACAAAFDWLEQAQSYGPWLLGGAWCWAAVPCCLDFGLNRKRIPAGWSRSWRPIGRPGKRNKKIPDGAEPSGIFHFIPSQQ